MSKFGERVVLVLPGMDSVPVLRDQITRTGHMLDVYQPADARVGDRRPGVVFVPGDGPEDVIANAKDWRQYDSWGRLAAVSGLAGVTINHRSTNRQTNLGGAAEDVDAAFDWVREHAAEVGIDGDRLAIWTCSAGAPFALRTALRDRPHFLKGIVAFYPVMDLRSERSRIAPEVSDAVLAEFSAVCNLEAGGSLPPIFIARAGKDSDSINRSIESFLSAAVAAGVALNFVNHPSGRHAFDVRDPDERSRQIIRQTLDFLLAALLPDSLVQKD